MGDNIDSVVQAEGLTLDELNATSNRQNRVTKKMQLMRMLGMVFLQIIIKFIIQLTAEIVE